ncbi:hypothetical protein VTJ49DRAFT_2153 [Mycothermus thermophilus]|uniref:Uncharacterized protein n=1 Tax=Humicola insolens TaxID=85995 RepID=A0ABR3VNE4_HUMIN
MPPSLFDYLVENEPAFRKTRLPALYSEFQTQRTIKPDAYQANVSAWRQALSRIVSSGLAPSPRGQDPSLFVLHSGEPLARALESKQYGRPLALGAVVQEALAARDLIPLREFLEAKESVYRRSWSVWNLASWTMKQLGVADYLKKDTLPPGDFVVLANVEEAGRAFSEHAKDATGAGTRFERTFTKAHFLRTFNSLLVDGKQLSKTDADVILRFLSRDKGAIAYDGATVRINPPDSAAEADDEPPSITPEDESMAQIKELLANLTHQAALLTDRIAQLTSQATLAAKQQNRTAALAALRSRKLAEATLARRLAAANQLEEVAASLEHACDNVRLARAMEASAAALESLHARTGGVERVEEVANTLREQMAAVDEVASILAESAGTVVVDEGEIDEELEAMEAEERKKREEEAERARAEEVRKRLAEAGEVPAALPAAGTAEEEKRKGDGELRFAEDLMSRLSLKDEGGCMRERTANRALRVASGDDV